MYFLIIILVCGGCRKDIDDHYKRPDYLLGNAYEFLQKRGNFTLFLDAVERSSFKDALDGRGIYSVFAPSDEAFRAYMVQQGKTSVSDFTVEELELLVGFHIVEFAYKRDDFLAFTQTATSETPEEGTGYAHRFKTLAREGVKTILEPNSEKTIQVFQQEKFLPVISTTLLKKKRSPNFEAEYKFFFPNVNWRGDNNQFYVAGASVLESGIPIDNGYMYVIDKVMDPLKTVYDELSSPEFQNDYSLFLTMYNRFSNFEFDQDLTKLYAQPGDSLFLLHHYLKPTTKRDLPDIADEWTLDRKDNEFERRMRFTFNSFIPNNEAMQNYITSYFDEVTDQKEVPLLSLFYLLSSHIADRKEIILPCDIDKGIEGNFGETWPIKSTDVKERKFCSNGLIYGINTVLEPAIFSMVTEPLFKYKRFSTMANLYHRTNNLMPLVDAERDYTLFLLNNTDARETYGYSVDYNGNPGNEDVLGGRVKIKRYRNWEKDEYEIVDMNDGEQGTLVRMQTVEGLVEESNSRAFYATKQPFYYIYSDAGRIYGEDKAALDLKNKYVYEYPNGSGSGYVYEVENKFNANKENIGRAIYEDPKYRKFYQALLRAELIKLTNLGSNESIVEGTKFNMEWLNGDRYMVFAPVNSALDESLLPVDSLELDNYLRFHFVSLDANKIDDYILPNYGYEQELQTRLSFSVVDFAKLKINFVDDKRLRITNSDNQSAFTDGDIPFFATDGVIMGIDKMIMPGKYNKE
ncbi:MAG: fasciclin domain-containing protein [Marinifilaceae bacterium]